MIPARPVLAYDVPIMIDAHVHVGPWVLEGLEGLSCDLGEAVSAALVEGIGGLAVTRSDGGDNRALRRAVEKEARARLWFVPWIRPGHIGEAQELLEEPGPRVAGLKIHPSIDRTPISDRGYDDVMALSTKRGLPIIIHTGRWQEVAGFELALERARQNPDARFIFAHAGGNDFGLRSRCCARLLELGLDNVWLDLTGLGMPLLTRKLVKRLGAKRFIFGSDFPLGHPRVQVAHITAMDLDREDTEAILGRTAETLLGPPSNQTDGDPT